MLELLGAFKHQAMRDMDLVPRPFRGEGSEDPNEPLDTYHNQNVSYTSVAKGFAVRVHSDQISTSYDLRPKKREGTSEEGHKFYTEITAGREAHRDLLRSAPYFDRSDDSAALESTDRINILHHADPFSYQLTRHARSATFYDSGSAVSDPIGRCNNEYQFDEHARVTRTAFPGPGTENRLDVIENARLMGRNTMRAIENTALEEPAISKATSVGASIGNAIGGSGQPHGLIGVAHSLTAGGSGGVSAALHATPAILAAPAITYGMNRINRYVRLRGVLSGKEALKQRARDSFQEARDTREFYLDTAEEKVLNMEGYRRDTVVREWNAEKANLKEHASDFEFMYPQYLDKLDSVSSSGGSVAKKFAGNFTGEEIGVTPLATGLKLANAAEAHAIVKLYDRAKEAGLAGVPASSSAPSSSYTFDSSKMYTKDPYSHSRVAEWVINDANQGHAEAQYEIGQAYRGGYFTVDECTPARLGQTYKDGYFIAIGPGAVRRSYVRAAEWFTKAANQGHAEAQYWLDSVREDIRKGYV